MFKKNGLLKSPDSKPKEKYLLLFAVAFIGMMISFIPSMIVNKGIFLYYGDFNSQQMMFYQTVMTLFAAETWAGIGERT